MAVGTNKPWHHLRILFLECSPTKPLCMGLQIAGRAVGWRGTVLAPPAYTHRCHVGSVVLATRIHRTTAPVLARARMPYTFDWPFTYGACFDYAIPSLQGRTHVQAPSPIAQQHTATIRMDMWHSVCVQKPAIAMLGPSPQTSPGCLHPAARNLTFETSRA